MSFSESDFHWTFLKMIIDIFHPPISGQVNIWYITKMDVETIYKDKLKGKIEKYMPRRSKLSFLLNIKLPKTSSVKRKQTKHVFAVYK
jgi:hypothetical protein